MNNKVLVVDDDDVVRRTVKRVLEEFGFDVTTAASGQDCLEILKKGFHGLILMDIVMPEMDGWDTIEEMIKMGYSKSNIVCMLTGKETPDEKMNQFKEYVLDYIKKPFKNKELVEIVKQYLSYL